MKTLLKAESPPGITKSRRKRNRSPKANVDLSFKPVEVFHAKANIR
jgi:hypothetical protein